MLGLGAAVSVHGVYPTASDSAVPTTRPAGEQDSEPSGERNPPRSEVQPSSPHPEGVSEEHFRAAMARLAAGVVLVAAYDEEDGPRGAYVGMTATAFVSVSLDPPLVLLSVRTESRMDELLERQPLWGASILGQGHRQTAGRFAMKGRLSDRLMFQETPHVRGEFSDAPLIDGALAHVECRTEQRVSAGDHTLLVARVLNVGLSSSEGGPLLYYQGRYRGLS